METSHAESSGMVCTYVCVRVHVCVCACMHVHMYYVRTYVCTVGISALTESPSPLDTSVY